MAHRGEVGTEIAPALATDASLHDRDVVRRVDDLLRRACDLARALAGAEQAALNLTVDEGNGVLELAGLAAAMPDTLRATS